MAEAEAEERKAQAATEAAQRAAAECKAPQDRRTGAPSIFNPQRKDKEEADRRAASAGAAGFEDTVQTHQREWMTGVRVACAPLSRLYCQ